jgi:hypothetical protein
MQAIPLRGRVREVLGHSWMLTPMHASYLKQLPEDDQLEVYSDMLFARRSGFVCASCGLYLPDFVQALAILCDDLSSLEGIPYEVVINRSSAVVCHWMTAVVQAELRCQPGSVLYDRLRVSAPERIVEMLCFAVGPRLQQSITAGGGTIPQLSNFY